MNKVFQNILSLIMLIWLITHSVILNEKNKELKALKEDLTVINTYLTNHEETIDKLIRFNTSTRALCYMNAGLIGIIKDVEGIIVCDDTTEALQINALDMVNTQVSNMFHNSDDNDSNNDVVIAE